MITTLSGEAEELGAQGLDWLLGSMRNTDAGPAWTGHAGDDDIDPTLYSGAAGIVLALLEGHRHFGEDRFGDVALRAARALAARVEDWRHPSLYFGLSGMAFVLHTVGEEFGDGLCSAAADRALARVRESFDGTRWSDMFELLAGNAGIALGALAAGDPELALLAAEPYLRTAESTPGGKNWDVRRAPARSHHVAHGTLGIAYALARVGAATGRADLARLALEGVRDVVARNEADATGFLVPHSDPQHKPDLIERYSYGWCNGPAGDAQVFRLLMQVDGDPYWAGLADRCWSTVVHSGLPQRLRPGFWDNSGRCCGTAGVLALACDQMVETGGGAEFAEVLVSDLAARATKDAAGVRWSNSEHRATPSNLEPRTGWAMGNAGIVRELLRYARITTGREPGYAVQAPDQPAARAMAG